MSVCGEIYTADKIFTLLAAVTAVTNLTSARRKEELILTFYKSSQDYCLTKKQL